MFSHDVNEHESAGDIVVVIFPRLCNGFTDRLETCEMDNGVDLFLFEDFVHRIAVENVCEVELHGLAGDGFHAFEGLFAGVAEVVAYNDFIAGILEFDNGMRTDVACAACYKNSHNKPFLVFIK